MNSPIIGKLLAGSDDRLPGILVALLVAVGLGAGVLASS